MNNLTATELKVLNNISNVLNPNVNLGAIIENMILTHIRRGTPVNAVNATKTLTLVGVVIHGETITIDNPRKTGIDVYEFLADEAQEKTSASNIAVDITASVTAATGSLTMDTQPTSGDTVTIGTKTYTFVPVGTDTADGEVSIGENLAGAQAALVAAINGTDEINTKHTLVSASAFETNVMTLTALIGGTAANSIATTETFTAETNVFAAATLGSGADCSAANAITAFVAAITASDTQEVGGADGAGDTIVLTADVAGMSGNSIGIAETLANGSFAADAVFLSGGVDGTVAPDVQVLTDDTYIYLCIAENTVSGKNWRRFAYTGAF